MLRRLTFEHRPCSAPSRTRGRSGLLGPVAVGVGDYFHQMTVGVVEIDAATAVQMIPIKETRGGLWKLWATSA